MLDAKTFFSFIAILLIVVAYVRYVRDVWNNKTTPHAYTWFIFGLVTSFVFGLQITAGAGVGSLPTLFISISVFIIFILSLFKGERHITLSDKIFFVLALLSFVLWVVIKQPILSVVLLSTINALAFIPTVRKSWNNPFSETMSTYVLNTTRLGISLLALEHYNVVTYFFPLSAMIVTFLFVVILIIRRRTLRI